MRSGVGTRIHASDVPAISVGLLRQPFTSWQSLAPGARPHDPVIGDGGTQSHEKAVKAARTAWSSPPYRRRNRVRQAHPRHTSPAESMAWTARHSFRAAATRAVGMPSASCFRW